eukprot:12933715-Prorocentrum_lima.AAC.1
MRGAFELTASNTRHERGSGGVLGPGNPTITRVDPCKLSKSCKADKGRVQIAGSAAPLDQGCPCTL